MTFPSRSTLQLAAALALLGGTIHPHEGAAQDGSAAFQLGVAHFDVDGPAPAAALEVAFQGAEPVLWRLRPQVGGMVNGDGGAYGYLGLALPWNIGGPVHLTPSFGAGGYRIGDSLDLGSRLEFRSGVRLAVEVADGHRVGLFLYHLSNASLGDHNPGTEVLGVGYSSGR